MQTSTTHHAPARRSWRDRTAVAGLWAEHRPREVCIIGAGPTGLALAGLLGRAGHRVVVHEARSRDEHRAFSLCQGRRISVDLSARATRVLELLGAWQELRPHTTAVRSRRVCGPSGLVTVLPFVGLPEGAVYTTSRARLTAALMQALVGLPGVQVRYSSTLESIDPVRRRVVLGGVAGCLDERVIVGCDGAGSRVRDLIVADTGEPFSRSALPHRFRPLSIEGLPVPADAMSLWRHPDAVLALQPAEVGLTGALLARPEAFAALDVDPAAVLAGWFPALAAHAGRLAERLAGAPTLSIPQVSGSRWRAERFDAIVLGDAAHAMAPFFGQGIGCALEDCRLLCAALQDAPTWAAALAGFEALRIPDTQAAAVLSAENYPELSCPGRADAERAWEATRLADAAFVPVHSLVCFSHQPYREILAHRDRLRGTH